ncbi:MAG: RtcB family protein [Nanoarchaeota archaeon]|jgi:tRNA-splicing ligase RtcB|nr:RtcB family protein [Nanoarchaeota archaeon]
MAKTSFEIEKEKGMNVPGRVYASEKLFKIIEQDKTLLQIKNVAKLPGIIGESIALPDAHQGYGFCIGGVAGFDLEKGVVSPGGVGYDINCGVRMVKTNLTKKDIQKNKEELLEKLYAKVPSGVGRGSPFQLSKRKLDAVLEKGAKWLIEEGYGLESDSLNIEEEGSLIGNPEHVSDRAKKRGIGQLGTLGAGNHFLELQYVSEIFDEKTAKVFGLKKDQVVILIHCGSRGLGHQVASDYIKEMEEKYGHENLPDRELINAPIKSELGQKYLSAMNCAANFAFTNRQLITHWTREVFTEVFPKSKLKVLYDVCHNIAKIEEHDISRYNSKHSTADSKRVKICVHRKGATRSFGPGRKEIPEEYRKVGQPVLLPGSMGTSSYILVGTKEAEQKTFGSCAHGAGRSLSRFAATKQFTGKQIKEDLCCSGISIKAGSEKGLAEEAPAAYKDVDEVVSVIEKEKLGEKVAQVKPMLVIKG